MRDFLIACTNLVRDPQVVTALGTYWAAAPTDCVIAPNTLVPVDFDGPARCAKVDFTFAGSSRAWESEVMAATASQKYTLQAAVYAPYVAAGGSITIAAVVMNGAAEVRSVTLGTVTAANTTAVRYANTVTIAASGETHVKYRYTFAGASSGCYVSAHKNANLAYLDPYHDGATTDIGSACAWTGTANESTSTRAASDLQFTALAAALGPLMTIAVRFKPYFSSTTSASMGVGVWGQGATSNFCNLGNWSARWNQSWWNGAYSAGAEKYVAATWAADDLITVVSRIDETAKTLDINVNGTDAAQAAMDGVPNFFTGAFRIGAGRNSAIPPLNGMVGPLVGFRSRLSDGDVDALQADDGALFDDLPGLVAMMAVGDVVFPLDALHGGNGYQKIT